MRLPDLLFRYVPEAIHMNVKCSLKARKGYVGCWAGHGLEADINRDSWGKSTSTDLMAAPFSQVMSELFERPSASSTSSTSSTADTALVGKENPLLALSAVCSALAFGAEPGEDLDEIRRGSLVIKVRMSPTREAVVAFVGRVSEHEPSFK